MPALEAQKRANAKHHKKMKSIAVALSPNRLDVHKHAKSHDNMAGCIKRLIR